MIDLGEFTPTAAMGPIRSNGTTMLGRLTTTEEQRTEAIEWLAAGAKEHRSDRARATVNWSRGEPTILELEISVEHFGGRKVYLPGEVTELLLSGSVVPSNEEARLRRLEDEATDLHEKGML